MSSITRLRLTLLVAAVACGTEPDAARVEGSTATVPETAAAVTYSLDTLWRVVSGDSGAPLSEPAYIAAGLGGIWVTDRVHGLVAFDPAGRHTRSFTNIPGLMQGGSAVAALALGRDSTIVLANRSGGRLTFVSPDGRSAREILLEAQWRPNAICRPSTDAVLMSGGDPALGLVVRESTRVEPVAYPWPALRDSSILLQQVVMATSPGSEGCVLAAVFGGGFATTEDGRTFRTYPTREMPPLPAVSETVDSTGGSVTRKARLLEHTPATTQVAASDTLIALSFGGTTPLRLGLVELYHRRTGAYLGSAVVGAVVRGLALAGDTLVVLHTFEDRTVLSALRLVANGASLRQ